MKTLHSEAQISVASTSQTDSILNINGKKAVATKNLVAGFEITKSAFDLMWKRNQVEFLENKDWNWYNSTSLQIVSKRETLQTTRIFWTTGVSKASTKFNSVKAKEFAQKMFDNYGSQLDGQTKLVKIEPQASFDLPNFTNPVEAARAWANEFEAKNKISQDLEEKNQLIQIMQPKVQFIDDTFCKGQTGLTSMKIVAQEIGTGAIRLYKLLRDKKIWQHPLNEHGVPENLPMQKQIDDGNFVVKQFWSDRQEKSFNKIFATNKGKLLCYEVVKKDKEQQNTSKFEIILT